MRVGLLRGVFAPMHGPGSPHPATPYAGGRTPWEIESRPVSRVLSREGSGWSRSRVAVIPLRSTSPWISSGLPESARGSALRTPFPKVHGFPIWPCSRWGLPCQPCCQDRGALLPHRFTLAVPRGGRPWGLGRSALCCTFREHASCAGEFPAQKTTPQALPGTLIRRSPDFPPPRATKRFRPS